MSLFKRKSEAELKDEWLRLSKNRLTWILVKGIISYGLPLGLVVYITLYISESVPKDDIIPLIQVMGVFFVFGIVRAIYRYNYFNRKYSQKN
jgi:hypothetical protein